MNGWFPAGFSVCDARSLSHGSLLDEFILKARADKKEERLLVHETRVVSSRSASTGACDRKYKLERALFNKPI